MVWTDRGLHKSIIQLRVNQRLRLLKLRNRMACGVSLAVAGHHKAISLEAYFRLRVFIQSGIQIRVEKWLHRRGHRRWLHRFLHSFPTQDGAILG
jgi:hypothetical protein